MFRSWWVPVVALAAALACPAGAAASTWSWPLDGRLLLPYAASWFDAGGRECSHGGVDISGETGADVGSCVSGRVTFAGRVPVASGGTATAVSVMTADGQKVTYLPLGSACVAAGTDVEAGAIIGTLAGSGDASSKEAHLHLSVKRGEAPIDPMTLLEAPTSALVLAPGAPSAAARPGTASGGAASAAGRAARTARPLQSRGSASVRVAPPARAAAASPVTGMTRPVVVPHVEPGAALATRIRPMPARLHLDVRAVAAYGRTLATAGRGMGVRLLLGALAALVLARTVRRVAGRVADAAVGATALAEVRDRAVP